MGKRNDDCKKHDHGPMFDLLKTLNPGTDIEDVFINGKEEDVDAFASFDPQTGLVTFSKCNGEILVVDFRRIDALEFN
ncbi:hypothetical protein [Priestia endophytica]|uniref:hypothetical protein n=1 Tax=Priestia endophytica TaxID=135735 RepID=UPI00227DDA58|nr:hypothetical protein [Priestia endophytica]MCY8233788.1 hypothetical protein [Priestia endophytica]